MYFSRDARMFEDAEVSSDIEGMVDSNEVEVQGPSAKLRLHFGVVGSGEVRTPRSLKRRC